MGPLRFKTSNRFGPAASANDLDFNGHGNEPASRGNPGRTVAEDSLDDFPKRVEPTTGAFGGPNVQMSEADAADVAGRSDRALRFAHAVRTHPRIMKTRVGVHVGAVVGGLVG